jgi:hypothetical protein
LVALQTALSVAAISSKPLPQFRYGIERLQGPGTSTSDSIPAMLSKGERITPTDINNDYFPALSAIHNRKIRPEIANKLLTIPNNIFDSFPSRKPLSDEAISAMMYVTNNQIDYDRLADKISEKLGLEELINEMNYQSKKQLYKLIEEFKA